MNTPNSVARDAPTALSYAAMCVITIPVFAYLWAFQKFSVNMPAGDDYDVVLDWLNQFLATQGLSSKVVLLVEQHNEHRILFGRLVFLLQYWIHDGVDFIQLDLVGLFGLVLIFSFLCWIIRSEKSKYVIMIPIAFMIFNLRQFGLISFAMASIQQYWQLLFALLSLYMLQYGRNKAAVGLATLLGMLASFTGAGGLLVFPVGALYLGFFLRERFAFSVWIGSGIVIFALYFVVISYNPPPGVIELHQTAAKHPFQVALFALAFAGSYIRSVYLAALAGLAAIVVFLLLTLKYMRSEKLASVAPVATMISYIFLTATAAGVGRTGMGIAEAISSRYVIYACVLFSLLFIYTLPFLQIRSARLAVACVVSIFVVFVYVEFLPSDLSFLRLTRDWQTKYIGYPDNARAISILKNSMERGIFMPNAIVFANLPQETKANINYLYPVLYSLDKIIPVPREMTRTLANCDDYYTWAKVSKLYFSHFDLRLSYPLNSTESFRRFIGWAINDSRTSEEDKAVLHRMQRDLSKGEANSGALSLDSVQDQAKACGPRHDDAAER